MPPITNVASVTITRETRPQTRSAFGTLLIFGDSAVLPDVDVVVMTFSDDFVTSNAINGYVNGVALAEQAFDTDNDTTIAALATKLQALASITTAVASGEVGHKHVITCTAADVDTVLQITDFVVTGGASQATCAIVRTPFRRTQSYTSLAEMVTDGYSTTDPEYVAADAFFGNRNPGSLKVGRKDAGEDWDDELDAVVAADNDWYALAITSKTIAVVTMVMDWVEAAEDDGNKKRFMASSNDANNLVAAATSDIGYHAANNEYNRSSVCFLEGAGTTYPECARFADELSRDPGSYTAMFKTTDEFTPSPAITVAQRAGADAKYVNLYETYGDVDMWAKGTVGSGEFEDTIRGIDWLENDMAVRVFRALATAAKVPYTDAGLSVIEAEVRASLQEGVRVGLLREDPDSYENMPFRVTRQSVSEISAVDRAARTVPSTAITFRASLAGAVHLVEIAGTVAV